MTTYAVERERFLVAMRAEGMPLEIARRILRHANTVQRLAVMSCNGVRNRVHMMPKHQMCGATEGDQTTRWADVTCPDCLSVRAERLIQEWCTKAGASVCDFKPERCHAYHFAPVHHKAFVPIFGGDPRGACVKLKVPSGKTDDIGREGICVPTRRY